MNRPNPAARGRIAVVHPFPNLDTVPSLCRLIELLADRGHAVDVIAGRSPEYEPPRFDSEHVRLRPLPSGLGSLVRRYRYAGQRTRAKRLAARVRYAAVAAADHLLSAIRQRALARDVRRRHADSPYRWAIGVDPEGLALAHRLLNSRDTSVAYLSLELLLSPETGDGETVRRKREEVELSRRAELVLVQDEERARLLVGDNGLDEERIALLPNSPPGPARRRPSRYWHERFGLAPDQRVVLHAGSLAPWTGVDEIVDSVATWPDGFVLVVHSGFDQERAREGWQADAVARLHEAGRSERVFLSTTPVGRQEYDELLDGADIGIAFYRPHGGSTYTGENVRSIGLSSGKVAYYLRAGLPVVISRGVGLGERLESEGCGVAVGGGHEVGSALARIAERYDDYSRQAAQVFAAELDPSEAFKDVLRRMGTATR